MNKKTRLQTVSLALSSTQVDMLEFIKRKKGFSTTSMVLANALSVYYEEVVRKQNGEQNVNYRDVTKK